MILTVADCLCIGLNIALFLQIYRSSHHWRTAESIYIKCLTALFFFFAFAFDVVVIFSIFALILCVFHTDRNIYTDLVYNDRPKLEKRLPVSISLQMLFKLRRVFQNLSINVELGFIVYIFNAVHIHGCFFFLPESCCCACDVAVCRVASANVLYLIKSEECHLWRTVHWL